MLPAHIHSERCRTTFATRCDVPGRDCKAQCARMDVIWEIEYSFRQFVTHVAGGRSRRNISLRCNDRIRTKLRITQQYCHDWAINIWLHSNGMYLFPRVLSFVGLASHAMQTCNHHPKAGQLTPGLRPREPTLRRPSCVACLDRGPEVGWPSDYFESTCPFTNENANNRHTCDAAYFPVSDQNPRISHSRGRMIFLASDTSMPALYDRTLH
jgi:hypothetical protein